VAIAPSARKSPPVALNLHTNVAFGSTPVCRDDRARRSLDRAAVIRSPDFDDAITFHLSVNWFSLSDAGLARGSEAPSWAGGALWPDCGNRSGE